jgi:hypothetical protein
MLSFDALLIAAAAAGLIAAGFWVRVAASRSLIAAAELDGTEKLVARANRRALSGALIASGLTLLLLAIAVAAGRSAGAL